LRTRLAWYRAIVAADAPLKLHHMDIGWDATGAPSMTRAFVRYITEEASQLQQALATMARGGPSDRTGALYLYLLACSDFDPVTAGQRMVGCHHTPRCADDPGSEALRRAMVPITCSAPLLPLPDSYAPWYAEKALARLRERLAAKPPARKVTRPAWMDRAGIGKEAKHGHGAHQAPEPARRR
jgi:hypothetical protein